MAKGIVLGLVFGALIGAAGVRLVDRNQGKRLEEIGAKVGEQDPRLKPGAEDVARLEKALAQERNEKEALQKKVGDLEAVAAAKSTAPAVAAKGSRWKEVGSAFYKLKDSMKGDEAGSSPESQQALMEFLGLLGKLAKEHGVNLDEIAACPDAMPAFLLSIMEAAGIRPDAAQQAAIDAAMAAGEGAWKDYLEKRGELTGYERRLELLGMQGKTLGELRGAFGSEGGQVADDMQLFDADLNFGGRHASFGGSALQVSESLKSSWAKDLRLDESQRPAMGLVVDEFMRDVQAAKDEFARRESSGLKVTERDRKTAALEAMIRAQKKLAETIRLSEEQAKALKDWGTEYSFNATDPGK
ncbi:MAG: hypothetical protein FD180_1540 [Planctomycetota bacterium]|nr:MAG: hypothetical protein FD180_1540 [Planctomycetota bacterium]